MDILQIISYIILPAIGVIIVPYLRALDMRIRTLEDELSEKVTDQQVRQILNDKYEPLNDRLKSLDDKLDKIYDLMFKINHKRSN